MLKIDLHSPDFYFKVSDLEDSSDAYKIFRHHGITKAYVYVISYKYSCFKDKFLKVGMSHPALENTKREHQVGERVVRQLAWIPGWGKSSPQSKNGEETYIKIQKLIDTGELPQIFDRNMLTVAVYNITSQIPNIDPNMLIANLKMVTEWAEGELCRQITDEVGWRPPLNFVNPSISKAYKTVPYDQQKLDELFEIQ